MGRGKGRRGKVKDIFHPTPPSFAMLRTQIIKKQRSFILLGRSLTITTTQYSHESRKFYSHGTVESINS